MYIDFIFNTSKKRFEKKIANIRRRLFIKLGIITKNTN